MAYYNGQINDIQNIHEQETPQHDKLCAWFSRAFYCWREEFLADYPEIELKMEHPIKNYHGTPVRYIDFLITFCGSPLTIVEIKPTLYSMGTTVRQINEYKTRLNSRMALLVCYNGQPEHYEAISNEGIRILAVDENDDKNWLFEGRDISNYEPFVNSVIDFDKGIKEYEKEKSRLGKKILELENKLEVMKKNLTKGGNEFMERVKRGHGVFHTEIMKLEHRTLKQNLDSLKEPTIPDIQNIPYYVFFSMLLNVEKIKEDIEEIRKSSSR